MKSPPEKFAEDIMGMNRHERRKFAKQNKIPIVIVGSRKPYVKEETLRKV